MGRKKKETVEAPKVEQVVFEIGKPIEGKTFKGETFEMTKTTHGIVYRLYGGYVQFVAPNNVSLYNTLDDLIENQAVYAKLTGKEREDFDLNLSAITYVLNVPLFAFSDAEFTFDIATKVIEFLRTTYDKLMSEPLTEETEQDVKDNIEFEEATKAMGVIQEALREEA